MGQLTTLNRKANFVDAQPPLTEYAVVRI